MATVSEQAARYGLQLHGTGVRMTRQRLSIIRALAVTVDHADAIKIFERASAKVPSISLSTVYRTMRVLEQRWRRSAMRG